MPASNIFITGVTNLAPTVALNTPADAASTSDLTPTLNFTGTDSDADEVEYNVQVSTASSIDIIAVNKTANSAAGSITSQATASVTPSANKLLLLTVSSRTGITVDPNEPTVTGCGLTWVSLGSSQVFDPASSSRRRITVFRALGASPTTGALTIDFGGQTQSDVAWNLDEFTGMDISGTNGSGAIVQVVGSNSQTVTSKSVTLAAFGNAKNATYGAFGNSDAGLGTPDQSIFTAGSGFTITGQAGNGAIRAMAEFKATNDTGVDATCAATDDIGGIAVEIKSGALDVFSASDAGFTAGHPFPSGDATDYTIQSDLIDTTTYYWRVRAKDPLGSNDYGAWTSIRSFVATSPGASAIKTVLGLAVASVKTVNGLAIASVKSINGLT